MFHSYFERKNDKVLTFNITHFLNFEMSASHLIVSKFNKRRGRLLEEIRYIICMIAPFCMIAPTETRIR